MGKLDHCLLPKQDLVILSLWALPPARGPFLWSRAILPGALAPPAPSLSPCHPPDLCPASLSLQPPFPPTLPESGGCPGSRARRRVSSLKTRGKLASADPLPSRRRERGGSLSTSEGTVHFDEPELELVLRLGFSEETWSWLRTPGPCLGHSPPAPVTGPCGAPAGRCQGPLQGRSPSPRLPWIPQ